MDLNPSLGVDLRNYALNDILVNKLWRITEKIDGVRRLFHKNRKGEVKAYSRSGKADPWLVHITKFLERENFPKGYVYDTELVDRELYFSGEDSYIIRARTIGKAAEQFEDNKKDLVAICFDIFKPEGDLTTGTQRALLLAEIFREISLESPIFLVTDYGALWENDSDTLSYLMDRITLQKKEGLMLNNLASPYIHGRSTDLIKVKKVEDFIGQILDIEIGEDGTKVEGMMSSLICKVEGCNVPVRVGTGFSVDDRLYFTNSSHIGELIEIEAFGKTHAKKGTISLNMPVFKRLLTPLTKYNIERK